MTNFQCPKSGRIGKESQPWYILRESWHFFLFSFLFFLNENHHKKKNVCIWKGHSMWVINGRCYINYNYISVNPGFPSVFSTYLSVLVFKAPFTKKHAVSSLCFLILFPSNWAISLCMLWGLGLIISLFMPFPLAKAKTDMRRLQHGNKMAHWHLPSVRDEFAT